MGVGDSIYLMGSEDVRRAAGEMRQAADQMTRAASEIRETLNRFLDRFAELVEMMSDKEQQ
jgi:methyl-accepting chemotaxis protein